MNWSRSEQISFNYHAKIVAFGHFVEAADRNVVVSELFHDSSVSRISFASSKVIDGSLMRAAMSFSVDDDESGESSFRTRSPESDRRTQSL